MARVKRRLVVVSNRGPYHVAGTGSKRRMTRAAGGLVSALDPVLRGRGGVWVSAQSADSPRPGDKDPRIEFDLADVRLSRAEQDGFYQGVSNAVLWPTMHSLPTTIRIGQAPWHCYLAANKAFTTAILENSQPNDLVWVQDFHLMLVPHMLRAQRSRMRIGWFCHVPWPSPDLFAVLPWRRAILEGMLGADLLGFHTESYALNFLACVERIVSDVQVDLARMAVKANGRTVKITVAPIGVAFDEIQTIASDPRIAAEVEQLHHLVNHRRIVLGVDRLDYTKGIPERILAYEQFLRADRSARNRFVFVQVMVPSRVDVRAYAELKAEVDRLVGDINEAFGVTLPDPLSPDLVLASIGNIVTWEFVGYNMLIFYAALRVIDPSLYEAAEIDGASQRRVITAIKLPAIRGALVIATIFSIIGSFQLFNEPSILQNLAPNAITTYFTPNMYAFSLSFSGQQHNYAATVAIVMGLITMVIAYVVQLRGMRRAG
jgi:trehalose-6-phosphate synthase